MPARAGRRPQPVDACGARPGPSAADIEKVLSTAVDQADGTAEPLASWMRVWTWSPVLALALLTDFVPLLTALRERKPTGPPDPRAAALAPDAGADGYALGLQRFVAADPAAWTADVPGVLAAVARTEFGAFYLAVAAIAVHNPDAFPTGPAGKPPQRCPRQSAPQRWNSCAGPG
ncbi:hypothetical protein [Streptomyces sp. NPDC048643]|uniref:hypothetical protein n=1 Tax=Streptomyces sp. NPDC048643 TaxID=3155637 RepID=UPI003444E82D